MTTLPRPLLARAPDTLLLRVPRQRLLTNSLHPLLLGRDKGVANGELAALCFLLKGSHLRLASRLDAATGHLPVLAISAVNSQTLDSLTALRRFHPGRDAPPSFTSYSAINFAISGQIFKISSSERLPVKFLGGSEDGGFLRGGSSGKGGGGGEFMKCQSLRVANLHRLIPPAS